MTRLLETLVREVCSAIKAAQKRDLLHAELRGKQKCYCLVNTVFDNILMEGEPSEELHHSIEIAGIVTECVSDALVGDISSLGALNESYNASEGFFLLFATAITSGELT